MATAAVSKPLAGMSGIYGSVSDPLDSTDYFDQGVLEAKANAPDPEHGEYGSQSYGYSGTVPLASPFSDQPVYDGAISDQGYIDRSAGDEPAHGPGWDHTPTTHASPYPRGIMQQSWDDPDGYALVGEQLQAIHGPDMGAVKAYLGHAPAGHEEVTDYSTDLYDAPNQTMQAQIPGQLKGAGNAGTGASGHGNADTVQGYGSLNMEPFDRGRSMRRIQHDRMPWDMTNTHGEQNVPFLGRHPVGQMPLNGPDSPYYGMGDISGAQIPWEGRIGDPTAYVQPPEVTTAPAISQSQEGDIYATF